MEAGESLENLPKMKAIFLICLSVYAASVCHGAVETVNADVVVDSAERTIDVASQLVKMTTKLTLSNNGKGAITGFHYGLEESVKSKLVFIGATVRFHLRLREVFFCKFGLYPIISGWKW